MPEHEFPDWSALKAARAALAVARDETIGTQDSLELAGADTALSVGLAVGALDRAAALLDRDIVKWAPKKMPRLATLNQQTG